MNSLKINEMKSGRLADPLVIQRILSGEKELYEILIKRYNQTLYRVIRGYLKDDEVDDVMQETYIKVFKKLQQFEGQVASFSTWLIRIGVNEALQHIRKKKRNRVINIFKSNDLSNRILNLPDSTNMNPEKRLINSERRMLIESVIDKLPEKYRIVFILREVEGMINSEIALCLKISESNVKVRFHRAKELMKEKLFQLSSDRSLLEFGNTRCDQILESVMLKLNNQ